MVKYLLKKYGMTQKAFAQKMYDEEFKGKPEDKIENILKGKVRKYYEEVCLENQIFVKAENKESVATFVKNNGGSIVGMIRYEVGEGMQKREENFAEEVAKQMQGN